MRMRTWSGIGIVSFVVQIKTGLFHNSSIYVTCGVSKRSDKCQSKVECYDVQSYS